MHRFHANPLKSVSHHHINALCHQKAELTAANLQPLTPSLRFSGRMQTRHARPLGERSNDPRYVRKICNKTVSLS